MKLAALIIVTLMLAFGWLTATYWLAVSGSILFIAVNVGDLVSNYRASKQQYASGAMEPNSQGGNKDRIAEWLNHGLGLFGGLGAMAAGMIIDEDNELANVFLVPGTIIGFGSIVLYFVAGVMVQQITGVRMRMGYGGWYVPRSRRRRGRRR